MGSERALDKEQEPTSAFGQELAPTNEYEMMRWVYNHAAIPEEMKKIKTLFVFTLNTIDATGKVKRANTGDTTHEWMKSNPKPGTCLIVSNQPFVGYQTEVTKNFYPDHSKRFPQATR